MKIVSANAEIERSAEIGGQPEILAQLPSMFIGQIFGDKPIGTQLGIAKHCRVGRDTVCPGSGIGTEPAGRNEIIHQGRIAKVITCNNAWRVLNRL